MLTSEARAHLDNITHPGNTTDLPTDWSIRPSAQVKLQVQIDDVMETISLMPALNLDLNIYIIAYLEFITLLTGVPKLFWD